MTDPKQNQTPAFKDLLLSIPGIGPATADKILALHSTALSLKSVSAEDLAGKISGLSLAKAKLVKEAVAEVTPAPALPAQIGDSLVDTALEELEEIKIVKQDKLKDELSAKVLEFEHDNDPNLIKTAAETESAPEETVSAGTPEPVDTEETPAEQEEAGIEITPVAMPANAKLEKASKAATEPKEDFVTFKKAQVHLSYAEKKARRIISGSTLLTFGLIITGLALIALSTTMLMESDEATPATPDTNADLPNVEPSVSDNPYIKLLTFSLPHSIRSSELDYESYTTALIDSLSDTVTSYTPPEPPVVTREVTISILNGNGIPGAARGVTDLLESAGFDITETANANNFGYTNTTIFFEEASRQEAESVQAALIGSYQVVMDPNLYPNQATDIVVVVGSQ